jgi:hypothetical protein
MEWTRIEVGYYRSMSPKTYTITKDGVGLFKEGWRPSWRLRRKDGELLNEFSSLRSAKVGAENDRRLRRMGRKRLLSRYKHRMIKNYEKCITAYHEAGHIIVEWLTSNRRIFSATCVPGDDYAGHVVLAGPTQKAVDPKTAKGMIMSGLAGNAAESLLMDRAFDLQSLNKSDRRDLLKYGPALCKGGDLDRFALSLAEETSQVLRDNREPL